MNAQREAVAQRLAEQFAADRISLDELERRLDLVYQAQSPAELALLTADLPAHPSATVVAAASSPSARAIAGLRPLLSSRVSTTLGNIERRGAMELPSLLEVRATLGNIELDLRDAAFPPFMEIVVRAVLGNVEITLPPGVRVENDGSGILGSFTSNITPGTMPMVGTSPVVRVSGRTILGNVEVSVAASDISD